MCIPDDPICSPTGNDNGAHTLYAVNGMASQAADYAAHHLTQAGRPPSVVAGLPAAARQTTASGIVRTHASTLAAANEWHEQVDGHCPTRCTLANLTICRSHCPRRRLKRLGVIRRAG
jgi:hypothetical protein